MKQINSLFCIFLSLFLTAAVSGQPMNDVPCGASDMDPSSPLFECDDDDGMMHSFTYSGSTAGATFRAPFPACPDVPLGGGAVIPNRVDPAGDVWLRFTASGGRSEITMTSSDFEVFQFLVFTGADCNSLAQTACEFTAPTMPGGFETILTQVVFTSVGEEVYVLVSGNTADGGTEGSFDLSVESQLTCQTCASDGDLSISMTASDAPGQYVCGSTVNICLDVQTYLGNDVDGNVEYIHSVVPTFGPGWDVSSIVPTVIPESCSGNGAWNWYPDGWISCATGDVIPRGFGYETDAGTTGGMRVCPDERGTGPGNNYGDSANFMDDCTNRTFSTIFCFNINVETCPADGGTTMTGEDLSFNFSVFSDGVTGSWRNDQCNQGLNVEQPEIAVLVCDDEEPLTTPSAESCLGASDGSVIISPNGGAPGAGEYNISIFNSDNVNVFQCDACMGDQNATGLAGGDYTVTSNNINEPCPQSSTFTINTDPSPTVDVDFVETCEGGGPIVLTATLNPEGRDPATAEYQWTDPNGMVTITATPTYTTADPAIEGEYSLIVTVEGCPSDPETVDVEYTPPPVLELTSADPACPGEDEVRLRVNGGTGPFTWSKNGIPDPSQTGNRYTDEPTAAEAGTTNTYSVAIMTGSCAPLTLDRDVDIAAAIDPIIEAPVAVCSGGRATFSLTMQDGSPYPAGWAFRWQLNGDNTSGNTGDTYVVTNNPFAGATQVVTVLITSPGGCSQTFTRSYDVTSPPRPTLAPAVSSICPDGSVELCVDVTGGTPPFTYQWNSGRPADTMRCQIVDASYPNIDTNPIGVTVTDAAGCSDRSNPAQVDVEEPLDGLIIEDCIFSGSSIPFSWNNVGQDYFEIYLTFDGLPEALVDGNYLSTSYTVDDLNPGEEVTIRVVPIRLVNGDACPGNDDSQTCMTRDCRSPGWSIDYVDPRCVAPTGDQLDVVFGTAIPGNITLNSTDLGLVDEPVPSNGEIRLTLPSLPDDGPRVGTYSVRASHDPGITDCVSDTIFRIQVSSPAENTFLISDTTICEGSTVSFRYPGDLTGLSFNWRIPGGADLISGDRTGPGPIVVRFPNIGPQTVLLDIIDFACGRVTRRGIIDVTNGPQVPNVICAAATSTSVTYTWPAQADVDRYEVVVDGGTPITITGTSYTVTGLNAGDSANIEVRALSNGFCGDGAFSDPIQCFTRDCPTFALATNNTQDTICLVNGDETIDLSTLTVTGGTGQDANIFFTGPGVVGTTFEAFSVAGSPNGTPYNINVNYTEAGGCAYQGPFTIFVFTRPAAFIVPGTGEVCVGGDLMIRVESTNFGPDPTRTVNVGDGQIVPDSDPNDNLYTLRWSTPGTKTVTATVTSSNTGCISEEALATFTVTEPLAAPVLSCGANDIDRATFTWSAVAGAEGYTVSASNGQMDTLDGGTNTYTVTGLSTGQSVTLSVTPTSTGPCGDGPTASLACSASSCPGSSINITTLPSRQCLDGNEMAIPLTAELDGGDLSMGTVTWTGVGVVDNGDSTFSFSPAGLTPDDYDVTVSYDGPDDCDSEDRITFTLLPQPDIDIQTDNAQTCINTTVTISLRDMPETDVTYDWGGFDGAASVAALGDEMYTVSWDTPGIKTIVLSASSAECTAVDSLVVPIIDELPAPQPACIVQQLNAVTFSWPAVPGATAGYLVSIDGGAPIGPQMGTAFEATGLMVGQEVSIRVTALRTGTDCNESPASEVVSCMARECPPLSLAPAAAQTEFCADEDIVVDLEANPDDDGSGFVNWSGPGVMNDGDGTWSFNPSLAGPGRYTLVVGYLRDGVCSVQDTLGMFVRALPDASFDVLTAGDVCVGQPIDLSFTPSFSDPSVTFDFDGGVFTPGEVDTAGSVVFATPGTYSISLAIDRGGCRDSTSQTVTVLDGANPGTPTVDQPQFCVGSAATVNLFDLLDGEDAGGTLSSTGDAVPTGVFDAAAGTVEVQMLPAGNYAFTYTVAGAGGCGEASSTVSITVLESPSADFTLSGTTTCTGAAITLTPAADEGATVTIDAPGATITPGDDGERVLTFASAGTYPVTLNVDGAGCTDNTTQTVTVQDELSAGSSPGVLTLCVSETGPVELADRLVDSDPGGVFSVASGTIPSGALDSLTGQLELSGLAPGSYAFNYTLDGGSCGLTSATIELALVAAPAADAGENQLLTCQIGQVTIGGTTTDTSAAVSYRWTNDTGQPLMDSTNAVIDVSQPGTYTLRVTNAAGCFATDLVTVESAQDAPVLQVDLSNVSCFDAEDGALAITDVRGGTPPYSFTLNGEDRGAATLFTGLTPQEYDLQVTDASGCSSSLLFDLTEPEALSIDLRFPNDTAETRFGEEITITALVNGGNPIDTLLWEPDSLIAGEGGSGIRFVATGTRMVSVTVVDSLGCTASDQQMLIVRKDRPVYIPTAFSPNGDGNNDRFFVAADPDLIVGLADFRIYNRWGELMWAVEDLDGQPLPANEPAFGWDGTLGGKEMNPQVFVYSVRIFFADGSQETYKGDFVLVR